MFSGNYLGSDCDLDSAPGRELKGPQGDSLPLMHTPSLSPVGSEKIQPPPTHGQSGVGTGWS